MQHSKQYITHHLRTLRSSNPFPRVLRVELSAGDKAWNPTDSSDYAATGNEVATYTLSRNGGEISMKVEPR